MAKITVHHLIIRNLLVGGFIISILAGTIIYVLEQNRLYNYVAQLAEQESVQYIQYYRDYYNTPSKSSLDILRKSIQNRLDHDLFIQVEVLDDKLQRVLVENLKDNNGLHGELNRDFSDFIMMGRIAHKKTVINDQFYIKIMVPIRNKMNNTIIGHFQGVYHVHPDEVGEIRNRIFLSVLQTVIIVLMTTALLYPIILHLKQRLSVRSIELLNSNINTIKSLGNAIAKRDSDTNSHNYRVTIYAIRFAENLGLSTPHIQALIKGAFLHDIGKIGISDLILLKPGKLSAGEFATMQQHVLLGKDIIENNCWLNDATDIVLYHHEKFDGSGYLHGLQGDNIPLSARMFAIVDVFDALTSQRPYKDAYSLEKSLQILNDSCGSHFDPHLLGRFESLIIDRFTEINTLRTEEALMNHLDLLINKYFTTRI